MIYNGTLDRSLGPFKRRWLCSALLALGQAACRSQTGARHAARTAGPDWARRSLPHLHQRHGVSVAGCGAHTCKPEGSDHKPRPSMGMDIEGIPLFHAGCRARAVALTHSLAPRNAPMTERCQTTQPHSHSHAPTPTPTPTRTLTHPSCQTGGAAAEVRWGTCDWPTGPDLERASATPRAWCHQRRELCALVGRDAGDARQVRRCCSVAECDQLRRMRRARHGSRCAMYAMCCNPRHIMSLPVHAHATCAARRTTCHACVPHSAD